MAFRRPVLLFCITTIVLGMAPDTSRPRDRFKGDATVTAARERAFEHGFFGVLRFDPAPRPKRNVARGLKIPGRQRRGDRLNLVIAASETLKTLKEMELHVLRHAEWPEWALSLGTPANGKRRHAGELKSTSCCDSTELSLSADDCSARQTGNSHPFIRCLTGAVEKQPAKRLRSDKRNRRASCCNRDLYPRLMLKPTEEELPVSLRQGLCSDECTPPHNCSPLQRVVSITAIPENGNPAASITPVTRHGQEEHEDSCPARDFVGGPRTYFEDIFGPDDDATCCGGRNDRKKTRELELSVVSICMTVACLDNRELRQTLLKFVTSLRSILPTPRELVQAAIKGHAIINNHSDANAKLDKEMKTPSSVRLPILPGIKSYFFSHRTYFSKQLTSRKSGSRFDLEKDTNGGERKLNLGTWSSWRPSFRPRSPVVTWTYPASFLPSMGSSPKDNMSHLGCRLASLNGLPASCDVSRVRLAHSGFYYDNGKTTRDASNVHEVVCFSCGVTNGRWAKGDNPTTVHQNLKPDCDHLKSLGVDTSRSGNFSSMSSSDGRASMSSSGASSGIPSIAESSSGSSMSSGYSSMMSGFSQGSSVPQSSLSPPGSGLGSSGFGSGVDADPRVPVYSAPRSDNAARANYGG